jgi:hypothetical protein
MLACGLIVAAAVAQAVFIGCTAPGADDRIRTATVREGTAAGPVTVERGPLHVRTTWWFTLDSTAPIYFDWVVPRLEAEGFACRADGLVLHAVHSTPGDLRQLTLRFEAGAPSRVSAVLLSQPD